MPTEYGDESLIDVAQKFLRFKFVPLECVILEKKCGQNLKNLEVLECLFLF